MGEAAQKEPSMEDILASIRKIVSEDDEESPKSTRPASAGFARREPLAGETSTTTGRVAAGRAPGGALASGSRAAPGSGASATGLGHPASDRLVSLAREVTERGREAASMRPREIRPSAESELAAGGSAFRPAQTSSHPAAGSTASATTGSAASAATDRGGASPGRPAKPAPEREVEAFRTALTSPSTESAVRGSLDRLKRSAMGDLDGKVEAVLRPMLREWLDNNLPGLVEKLVREEIERLARKD